MANHPSFDLPPGGALIEVHVGELKQLFHSLDPTPFRERDLDPKAEEFITGWARELPSEAALTLRVHVDEQSPTADEIKVLQGATRDYFSERAGETRRRLRRLFQVGRTSLAIGLVFLALSIVAGDLIAALLSASRFGGIARESLLIGGWVAMWRPLEIFLYDWWPIRDEAKLLDRLSAMTVVVGSSRRA